MEETETNRRPRRTACRPGLKNQSNDVRSESLSGGDYHGRKIHYIKILVPRAPDFVGTFVYFNYFYYFFYGLRASGRLPLHFKIKPSSRLQVTPKQCAKSFSSLKRSRFHSVFVCLFCCEFVLSVLKSLSKWIRTKTSYNPGHWDVTRTKTLPRKRKVQKKTRNKPRNKPRTETTYKRKKMPRWCFLAKNGDIVVTRKFK